MEISKILIIALSGIGDALMFTPALKKLKVILPNAEIDALVMFKGAEDIYKRLPYLSRIYRFDFLNTTKSHSLKFVAGLRNKYDAAINVYPSNRKEYNVINLLIGPKKRVGVNYLRKNFTNLGWLNNLSVKENDNLHNVEENIKLVEKLTGEKITGIPPLEFPLTNEDQNSASEFFKNNGITSEDLVIGFHPGCATLKNHIKRRWEPGKFSALANKLIEQKNAKILIFGGPEEDDLKKAVHERINPGNSFIVKTNSLAESAAVMKKCNIFVTNDSSLMHVASALKLNIIAIIGPTNTNYIHPWQTDHKIVSLNLECAPCFFYSPRHLICSRNDVQFKCIKELDVEMVYDAVNKFILEMK
jgi:heptosyltransferase II